MAGSGTLLSTLITRVRKKVNDESSRRFLEADILVALGNARRHVAMVFGRIAEAGYFEKDLGETAIAANAEYFLLPSDFMGIKTLSLVKNPTATGGTGLDRIDADKLRRDQVTKYRNRVPIATTGTRPVYWIRRSADSAAHRCYVLPISPTARYFNGLYHHTFPDLNTTAGSDRIDVPFEYDELVVLYASVLLCEDDKKRVEPLQLEYQGLEATRLTALQGAEDETGTEQVSSDWHDEFNQGYF